MDYLSNDIDLLPFPEDFMLESIIQQLYSNDSTSLLFKKLDKLSNIGKIKSEKKSLEFSDEGKQWLNKNCNREALSLFNKALVAAPGSSKHIASYYIDRSLALQKLKAYPESLQDIERALRLSITEDQKRALESRKTIINLLLVTDDVKKLNVTKKPEENEEKLSYGENEELVGVSTALSLKYNEKFGRHYVAARDIECGDILMIQKPFVHILVSEDLQKVIAGDKEQWICDNCLESILNPIPCEKCTTVIYCTEECKLESFKNYHDIECHVTRKYPSNANNMALRSLIISTNRGKKLEEIYDTMEKIDKCKDRTSGFHQGKLDGTKPEALFSLLTHTDKRKDITHIMNAAIVADILRKATDFLKGHNTYQNTVKIGNLFLKLSYTCQMNLYGIQGNNCRTRIAFAMFPVFNYLNNSCANNALWYDKKDQKILRACKNIQKGEQVCVAYMTHEVVNKTAKERKEFFEKIKFFTCECEACKANYNFKCELKKRLKISKELKRKLNNHPNDTKSLWELLKIVVNEYKGPCLEGKRIEVALVNAHLGSKNEDFPNTLRLLKIL